jgi:hypothetical protein
MPALHTGGESMQYSEPVANLGTYLQFKDTEDRFNSGLQVTGTKNVNRSAFSVGAEPTAFEKAKYGTHLPGMQ